RSLLRRIDEQSPHELGFPASCVSNLAVRGSPRFCSRPVSQRRSTKILARRLAESHSKRRDERARAVVADVERDAGDRLSRGEQPERVTETELLAPFAEAQSGL